MRRSAMERSAGSDSEAGYVLLAVIFLTVILLVSLAIAAPKIAIEIQRDKELETIHRGEQYKRALKLYYQKFGSYPTSVDQLKETNQMRFLRRVYADPLTGKEDWKPVLFGQAHVRPLGFFGQPLMTAGMGMGASMYAAAASTTTDANGVPIASPGQPGAGGASGTSGFGSSSSSFGSSGSSFGNSGSGFGNSSFGSSPNGSSPTGGSMFGSTPTSGPGSTSSPFGSSGSGTSATTFGGGGPIVGFTLPVDKPSLIEYKLQTRYNKWEFNYDPMEDQAQAMAGLATGGTNPANPNGTSTSPTGTPTSNPISSPTSNPGPGPNPTGPTDPTAPQ